MRQDIIDRYDISPDRKKVVIDVSVDRIEDLYDKFDSAAHYIKKDLNDDFVQYLIDCVREIKRLPFLIRINLPAAVSDKNVERVRGSIKNYFYYLKERESRAIRRHLSQALSLLVLGALLIFLSLTLSEHYAAVKNIAKDIFIEGITIAGWVSMWEAVANLIFEWPPHYLNIRLYRRIIASPVRFHTPESGGKASSRPARSPESGDLPHV